MNTFTVKTISNSFSALLLFGCAPLLAAPASFGDFCRTLAGHWQGPSAQAQETPKTVTTEVLCSADGRQLVISVSEAARHSFSETWWFRLQQEEQIWLTYYDGVGEDKRQRFSLYRRGDGYSLLGEGKLDDRPALIQLLFEPKGQGWQWLQQSQFLDDDAEQYRFYRGISLQPVKR
ncbi:hypothetical protein [Shewanella sedimentimangrovi]|uniref:DUF1579 domain-containing protein n=1 Tax=Shewanella sedimentimangrovi TaxID=2814293 RepID=A0ABX7QZY0_9GAMM|nr:hypothetical protein [Shewanella sedimentimangrovi]QSX37107.1 hypothetical protein JYB85_17945 [Shewanella sedimentimangrovi]